MRSRMAAALTVVSLLLALTAPRARAFTASAGERELAAIEARWTALAKEQRRDLHALAELDRRAAALAADASRSLAALREDAADHDVDMAKVVAGHEWQATEALLIKLKFRIAAIDLERARGGDPDHERLARAAADGFGAFADAPDPALAAEARYGRGLARIAAGDRSGGIADLRAAAAEKTVAPRARLALADALADGGDRTQALDVVTRLIAGGGLPHDLALRAKLLRVKLVVGSGAKQAPPDLVAQVEELLQAGKPWRDTTLALLQGHEDLLPGGADADPTVLLLRAEGAARRGDATAARELYGRAVARGGDAPDPAALDGLARAALATGAWQAARDAVARLVASGKPLTRETALIDLRAAYGAWQASPDAKSAAALREAADALAAVRDASADERAEAAFRHAEAERASGDLDASIAGFAAIDAPAWRNAAAVAALQGRVLRHARDPGKEPRDPLLRDLAAFLARDGVPADARATVVVLDATVRTTPDVAHAGAAREPPLDPAAQRAALARLRDFAKTFPDAKALLPAVLRAGALLELDTGGTPDPAMLAVLDEQLRPEVAGAVAGDLREEVAIVVDPAAAAPAGAVRDAATARGRRALAGALAFAALAPPAQRAAGRLDLAQAALALGDPRTATALFRAEADAKPTSLQALRGLALAAGASGDAALSRSAWDRLAAMPDLPEALRAEVDRARGAGAATPQASPAVR